MMKDKKFAEVLESYMIPATEGIGKDLWAMQVECKRVL